MFKRIFRFIQTIVMCIAVLFSYQAFADDDHRTDGMDFGIIRLYPIIIMEATFTDNVFWEESDEKEDYLFTARLGTDMSMNLGRHLLRSGYQAAVRRARDYEILDKTNHKAELALDLHFRSGMILTISDQFVDNTIDPRFTGDTRNDYINNLAGIKTEYELKNQYKFTVGYASELRRFDEEEDSIDDFDRYRIPVGLQYKITPNSWILFEYAYRSNDHEIDDKDNVMHYMLSGWRLSITDRVTGTFKVGYTMVDYDNGDTYETVPVFVDFVYKSSSYTTFKLKLLRVVTETTRAEENLINGNYYTSNVASIELQHEFTKKVEGNLSVYYAFDRFPNIPSAGRREDDGYGIGASLLYWFREYLFLSLGYRYRVNDSNFDVNDYIESSGIVQTGIRF